MKARWSVVVVLWLGLMPLAYFWMQRENAKKDQFAAERMEASARRDAALILAAKDAMPMVGMVCDTPGAVTYGNKSPVITGTVGNVVIH